MSVVDHFLIAFFAFGHSVHDKLEVHSKILKCLSRSLLEIPFHAAPHPAHTQSKHSTG